MERILILHVPCEHLKLDVKYRKAYFQWLKLHGYGHSKVGDLPHIHMVNPYGSSKKSLRITV